MHVIAIVLALWIALSAVVGVAWARAHRARPRVQQPPPRPGEDGESRTDLAS